MPKRLTEEEKRKRRERIMSAASELFAEKGIAKTTLKQISKKVKLSDPQILDLFEDRKNNIPNAIIVDSWVKINEVFQKSLDDTTQNEKEKCLFLFRAIIEILMASPQGIVFVMESRHPVEFTGEFIGLDHFAGLIDRIIQKGQQEGIFRSDLNHQAVRQQIIGCGENILVGWVWKKRIPLYPAEYTIDEACRVFEAILDGISEKVGIKPTGL